MGERGRQEERKEKERKCDEREEGGCSGVEDVKGQRGWLQ